MTLRDLRPGRWDGFKTLPGETTRQYEAFIAYRDLGPDRTLKATAVALNLQPTTINRWSRSHYWPERANAYDDALAGAEKKALMARASEQAKTIVKQRLQWNDDRYKLGMTLASRAMERFNWPVADRTVRREYDRDDGVHVLEIVEQVGRTWTPNAAIEAARLAFEIMQIHTGGATENIAIGGVLSVTNDSMPDPYEPDPSWSTEDKALHAYAVQCATRAAATAYERAYFAAWESGLPGDAGAEDLAPDPGGDPLPPLLVSATISERSE